MHWYYNTGHTPMMCSLTLSTRFNVFSDNTKHKTQSTDNLISGFYQSITSLKAAPFPSCQTSMTVRLLQHNMPMCCALTQLYKVHFTSNSEELKDTCQVW